MLAETTSGDNEKMRTAKAAATWLPTWRVAKYMNQELKPNPDKEISRAIVTWHPDNARKGRARRRYAGGMP